MIRINLNNFPEDFQQDGWQIYQKHQAGDCDSVQRLFLKSKSWSIELLPSKGFSIGQAVFKGQKIFWDAPIGLIDPHEFNPLADDVCIQGTPMKGFSFLKTFASGLELYGLSNWGMPVEDKQGRLLPLHGETSNIPVKEFEVQTEPDKISFYISFEYHSMQGETNQPWYLRGEKMFRVERNLQVVGSTGEILLKDRIINISDVDLSPDWGYHITLEPREYSRLLIPSKRFEIRGDGDLPKDIETWTSAGNEKIRTETGIIHKGLKIWDTNIGHMNQVLQKTGDSRGVLIGFTPSPYTQSWFCNGGAGSSEFTYRDGTPLFEKSWNGQGIEIGSSALDHDGNTDDSVLYEPMISPGEYRQILISVKPVKGMELSAMEQEIVSYNQDREE